MAHGRPRNTRGPAWDLVLRCVVIYFALLAGLRLTGKREVGQITLFDLVFVLLVANAVQPAMTGPDSSLLGGLIIIVVLLTINLLIDRLRIRNSQCTRCSVDIPPCLCRAVPGSTPR
jgi:uncharacterized membrane protein YcaP (DUF421 family)